ETRVRFADWPTHFELIFVSAEEEAAQDKPHAEAQPETPEPGKPVPPKTITDWVYPAGVRVFYKGRELRLVKGRLDHDMRDSSAKRAVVCRIARVHGGDVCLRESELFMLTRDGAALLIGRPSSASLKLHVASGDEAAVRTLTRQRFPEGSRVMAHGVQLALNMDSQLIKVKGDSQPRGACCLATTADGGYIVMRQYGKYRAERKTDGTFVLVPTNGVATERQLGELFREMPHMLASADRELAVASDAVKTLNGLVAELGTHGDRRHEEMLAAIRDLKDTVADAASRERMAGLTQTMDVATGEDIRGLAAAVNTAADLMKQAGERELAAAAIRAAEARREQPAAPRKHTAEHRGLSPTCNVPEVIRPSGSWYGRTLAHKREAEQALSSLANVSLRLAMKEGVLVLEFDGGGGVIFGVLSDVPGTYREKLVSGAFASNSLPFRVAVKFMPERAREVTHALLDREFGPGRPATVFEDATSIDLAEFHFLIDRP
ncbi:MAG TPA: hypothetical protein VKD22_03390, partial [Ramlibacter sp.]|nr:hypothetical protein [Ramlibacter sp.]